MTKVIKANGLLSLAIAFFLLCTMTFLAANYAFALPDCEACGGLGPGGSEGTCYNVSIGAEECEVTCVHGGFIGLFECECEDGPFTCGA